MEDQELASIKKAGEVEYVSKDVLEYRIKALARSKRDIGWWAENFFKIISLDRGVITIKLYEKQKELLQHFVSNDRSIVLASRQTGKTTSYTVFCLWLATLSAEKKIMVCANKLQTAIEIMDRIRLAYEYLPKWIKPGCIVYNKQEITFANKSTIRAFATSSSASRGFSGNVVIIDEMAFIPGNVIDEFFASVMPVISSSKNSKAIIVSTPNGAQGLYYNLWQQAISKNKALNKEGWKAFRIRWWETGGIRDEKWKEQQIATIGMEKWKQEFECDFLTSSTKRLIPEDVIDKFRMNLVNYKNQGILKGKKLTLISDTEDKIYQFRMWHCFDKNRTYAASGDISEGLGGNADSSVLYVWDVTDLSNITLCAKFESNTVSPMEFAFVTSKILELYANPWFIAERNGVSSGMIEALRITYKYEKIVQEGKRGEFGIFSHVQVKGKACIWCREMITTQGFGFTVYDEDLLDEFGTFIKKETKGVHPVYTAIPPAHDDHVMTFIWLCYLMNNELVEKYYLILDTFKTNIDQLYAKLLGPLEEYTDEEIETVQNNKLYKEFLEYENELKEKNNISISPKQITKTSNFVVSKKPKQPDIYFPNDPWDEQEEKTQSVLNQGSGLNQNNVMPRFYLGGGGGFWG